MARPPSGIEVLAPSPRIVFTTRHGGESDPPYDTLNLKTGIGDEDTQVIHNRRSLAAHLGITSKWVETEQVHGSSVSIHQPGRISRDVADAVITASFDTPLVIFTADCAPVALVGNRSVGAVHVGWRGLVSGIIEGAVAAMGDQDVRAWIGPAIGPCHFEVGPEVLGAFERGHPAAPSFTVQRNGRTLFDLVSATSWVLSSHGVSVEAVSSECTFCDDRFFSYRRDGLTGRQAMLVWRSG